MSSSSKKKTVIVTNNVLIEYILVGSCIPNKQE